MYCDWPQLARCCFCLPLRKGLLVIGYLSILYSAFMIGVYSYTVHYNSLSSLMYYGHVLNYGRVVNMPEEMCIVLYCTQLIFDAVLIYGAHMKSVVHIKAYYYFSLTTSASVIVLQIIDLFVQTYQVDMMLEMMTFTFVGFCMQLYLLTVIRSFLIKMQTSGPHVYDNQLHQIVTGEFKIETNGVYNNTTTPTEI